MATPPRLILPGATHLVTRRCSERRLFLRPSAVTNAIVLYALAVAAERYGVLLHAFCVLSNHLHLVLTDPRARLPDFERYFDSLVAKAVNCSLGRWESFWAPDSYSAVRLETTESILEKIVYALANPVAAGLVPHGCDWPGLWSDPDLFGGAGIEVKRPDIYFRKNGQMPASVRLKLTPPPGFPDHASFVELVRTRLAEAERNAADKLHEEGRTFLGRKGVLAQKPFSRPSPGEPRRQLSPRLACRDKWKRIEALQRLVEFRRAYAEALASWRAGVRGVLFPAGTWLMRVLHGVPCTAACV
jgi:REP element-mobilizing transposase RayT